MLAVKDLASHVGMEAACRAFAFNRGGSVFSDRGVSGYLSGQNSNRRADIHEKAKT